MDPLWLASLSSAVRALHARGTAAMSDSVLGVLVVTLDPRVCQVFLLLPLQRRVASETMLVSSDRANMYARSMLRLVLLYLPLQVPLRT